MDPYDAGYSFGRIVGIACCLIFALLVVGGIVWAVVYFARKQSKPPAAYPPAGQAPYPNAYPPAPPAVPPTAPPQEPPSPPQ